MRLHNTRDRSFEAEKLFASFLIGSVCVALLSVYGMKPPEPAAHWPGHSWIHFMKRLHVIMSIGCFLIEVCASAFSLFALHRVLSGGFDARAPSLATMLMRELEFEFVAVCSYFFAGGLLLMGPVAIHCFCMVQQGIRSNALAYSVCCLIVGIVSLILSFFSDHLVAYPYRDFETLLLRFVQLSLTRFWDGGRPAYITIFAWAMQGVSVILALFSLVETFPWLYYREFDTTDQALAEVARRSEGKRLAQADSGDGNADEGNDLVDSEDNQANASDRAQMLRTLGTSDRLGPLPVMGIERRPSVEGRLHDAGRGNRVSPVTTGAPSTDAASVSGGRAAASGPQHPWDYALKNGVAPRTPSYTVASGLSGSGGAPSGSSGGRAAAGAHRRVNSGSLAQCGLTASGSRVSSIASSMQSLDSNAVD